MDYIFETILERQQQFEFYAFKKVIGNRNFAACLVRCDISQATSQMKPYIFNKSPKHHLNTIRILRYLATCLDRDLACKKKCRNLSEI